MEKSLTCGATDELVIGLDVEWVKDYRVASGNKPFCFSFVFVTAPRDETRSLDSLEFGLVSRYVRSESEAPALAAEADRVLARLLSLAERVTLTGHQLPSDISVLLSTGPHDTLPRVALLRQFWHSRRSPSQPQVRVFDTRYDLGGLLTGESRRLVDVCVECGLDVTQPEIKSSMTRMQRTYEATQDQDIMERLSIVNIRHSLSCVLLFLLHGHRGEPHARPLNVNSILYRNLHSDSAYVRGPSFGALFEGDTPGALLHPGVGRQAPS